MFCASVIVASLTAVFLTAWAALVIQSLAGGGQLEPYFASEMDLRRVPDDDYTFVLGSDFTFFDSNGMAWTAPKNMPTDGASVGSLLGIPFIGVLIIWLIEGDPLRGPLAPAAVPHDYIYGCARDTVLWRALISMARAAGDRVIFEAARCRLYIINGTTIIRKKPLATWRAFAVMAILRVAGAKAWLDDSRAARSLQSISSRA